MTVSDNLDAYTATLRVLEGQAMRALDAASRAPLVGAADVAGGTARPALEPFCTICAVLAGVLSRSLPCGST